MNIFAVVFLCVQASLVQTSIILGTEVINNPTFDYDPGLAIAPSAITPSQDYRNVAGLLYTNGLQGIPGILNDADVKENIFIGTEGILTYANGARGVSGLFSNIGVSGVNTFGRSGEGNVAVSGKLPVAGKTAVIGQLPISGAVKFGGNLPATGALSVNARCTCLC